MAKMTASLETSKRYRETRGKSHFLLDTSRVAASRLAMTYETVSDSSMGGIAKAFDLDDGLSVVCRAIVKGLRP
jgi:hypothetical protein